MRRLIKMVFVLKTIVSIEILTTKNNISNILFVNTIINIYKAD